MKKNLFTVGFLAFTLSINAQVLVHVDKDAVFYVGENALVYSGGGLQTKDNGIYDIHGDVMVVGTGSDGIRTLNAAGTGAKTDGGNIILRFNDLSDLATSTYGQLYVQNIIQSNLTGIVDKEFKAVNQGTYQQIGLPFFNKPMASLSGELGKTFGNIRRSRNEILQWDNAKVEAAFLDISSVTPKSTTYYMVGTKGMTFALPSMGPVYTLRGVPVANGISEKLIGAGAGINFGPTGNAKNSYNEFYNTYLQDAWEAASLNENDNPYAIPNYGRNIYQFGNPFFTNLDVKFIGIDESTVNDGNKISRIRGIRFSPGGVISTPQGATYSQGAGFVNFASSSNIPAGDVGLIIRPLQTFVIKLDDNDPEIGNDKTLNFDRLRRFKYRSRESNVNYDVTAAKNAASGTLKQLGIIGLNEAGEEIARTYYVVYSDAISGHTSNRTVQSTLGLENIIGTYEEDAVLGGYDQAYESKYWLYINEANENDFKGKAIPLALYSDEIKSLKFEVRENTELIDNSIHELSSGIGFFYKGSNGEALQIKQNQTIPVTGNQYSLYYGQPSGALGTENGAKPSRTKVVYSQATDNFLVIFDPSWKKADVQVYDMSGKLIISKKDIITSTNYDIVLPKSNSAYIVTAVSESGEKTSSKIIR